MKRIDFWRRTGLKLTTRDKRQAVLWNSLSVALLVTVLLPTLIDTAIARVHPGYLLGLHYFVATIYAVTSLMILWETCASWRSARPSPALPSPQPLPEIPMCSAIIAAYLPNEQDIIVETIRHMLAHVCVPPEKFEVILAYNTPETLPIETVLEEIRRTDSRLRLLRVVGSSSKAENVNAALPFTQGEIVAVYDADHLPDPDCFQKAWRWIAHGYDMVQGRCVIRNHAENWLTRTVAVEFDCIYAVSHQGRSRMSGTAIFGGSNGYWRGDVLRQMGMDPAMLTEDIDVSVRSLLTGSRLAHDREIVSRELAPTQFQHWIFQRKRWAQGWLEVTIRHQRSLFATEHLNVIQKILWFYLLAWRELYPLLAVQFFALVLSAWLVRQPIHWFGNPYFATVGVLNLAIGPFLVLVALLRGSRLGRRGHRGWYLVYALTGLLYTSAKTFVTLVAQYSHWIHDRTWVTTPRTAPTHSEPSELNAEPLPEQKAGI